MTKSRQILRVSVEAIDGVLGVPFPVLDEGFVRVIDYMGSDESIVQAARISYGSGTKRVHEDRGLIRYLMRHHHTTPFEMCEIKLHVRVPMDCWRQWIRHRTASINEYSSATPKPSTPHRGRGPASGVGNPPRLSRPAASRWTWKSERCSPGRKRRCNRRPDRCTPGVSSLGSRGSKHARTCLFRPIRKPIGKLICTIFCTFLRCEWTNAQIDIRSYANVIGNDVVAKWCPLTWEAFLDYRIESQTFSRLEMSLLRAIHAGPPENAKQLAAQYGWLVIGPDGLQHHREREEFQAKLIEMGLPIPWEDSCPSGQRTVQDQTG